MKRNKNFLGLGIFLAVLMLAVGYAAIGERVFNITGTASAQPDDSSFIVEFSQVDSDIVTTNDAKTAGINGAETTANYTDEYNATMTVTGLVTKGQTASATFTVKNTSVDLAASLAETTATLVQSGDVDYTEYFSIKTEIVGSPLAAATGTATVKVTVTLEKSPKDVEPVVGIDVDLKATVA